MGIVERARKEKSEWWEQMQNFMKEVKIETEFTRLATKPTELKIAIDKANTKIAQTNKNVNHKRKNNKRKASKQPEEETTFSSDKKNNSTRDNDISHDWRMG